ncbi:Signal recognition particle SEC65 subunit [Penicillium sp. IBT 35674x]|nr:Signal recognition particle SEC65 subunit [Penicillium sp. IBT 35674x]
MSHYARVEELSDSDPDEVAPSEPLPRDSIIAPVSVPPTATPSPPVAQMPQFPQMPEPQPQREIPRHYQCLYPVYFDKTRSRAEGRKVGSELAVENPLARDIADAVQMLGLKTALEPEKLHPKDWANPGRVRVLLKDEDGRLVNSNIKNKHHLFIIVAQYLKAHPTNEQSPYRLRIRGLPTPEKLPEAPQAPRGWKIGTILPIHSPAYSGGGVSDNPFKEAMAELQNMQGMPGMPSIPGMPGMPGMSGESSGADSEKKKKDKKKGKA